MKDELARLIGHEMAAQHVPGLSLAVLRAGEIAETAVLGIADTEQKTLVTRETLFEAASLTKPLYAYAVLQLVDARQLDLDAPLFDLLPDLSLDEPRLMEEDPAKRPQLFHYVHGDPRLAEITIRRLLSHTAGLQNWTGAKEGLRIHVDPGTRWSYAGDGFQLLQDVLALHDGRAAEELVRERVLEPLGMAHSGLQDSELAGRDLAQPHDEEGKRQERTTWPQFYAAASLHTTAGDYGRFLQAVLSPRAPSPGRLSPRISAEMGRPQIAVNDDPPWRDDWPNKTFQQVPGVSWGLGWGLEEVDGRSALWHWGDNGNYKAFTLAYTDTGDGLVMFSNGRRGDRLFRPLIDAYLPGPHPALDWLESE